MLEQGTKVVGIQCTWRIRSLRQAKIHQGLVDFVYIT
jgi:hypothetical protein